MIQQSKSWSMMEATPAQKNAIHTYEQWYGIKISNLNKQTAHDVITEFMKDRSLKFSKGFIENTTARYKVTNNEFYKTHIRTDIPKRSDNITSRIAKQFARDMNSHSVDEGGLLPDFSDDFGRDDEEFYRNFLDD